MSSERTLTGGIVGVFILAACVCLAVCPVSAPAQDTTVFVDDFESFSVGTLSQGCGDMMARQWRWESHHFHACYSAGWGIDYAAPMSGSSTGMDKTLELWGGVPFGGGGDCAVTQANAQFQNLTDYSVTTNVSPEMLVNGIELCKSGMIGLAGRVQEYSTFCTGYLLALVLNNGESLCGQGSLLQLYRNERGPNCNGSEAMSLIASQPVDIAAHLGGNFDPDRGFILKLCLSGSDIYGGVWSAQEWAAGDGAPMAEVNATDDTYSHGTFGIYQGASRTSFDDVIVTLGESCLVQGSSALAADLDFDPNTLNLKSKGKYVTCYIELPEGYDPWDIDVATVMLNDVIGAELKPTGVGDHDLDGIDDRMVKFRRADVIALLGGADGAGAAGNGGTSGGGEFGFDNAAENGGTSGGGEFDFNSAAAGTGTSGGAEFGLSSAAAGTGTSGGAEYMLAGSSHGDSVEVWVSGLLQDGTAFMATDTVRVTHPGSGNGEDPQTDSAPTLTVTPSLVKGKTRVGFELTVEGHVSLHVYDAAGRMVKTLVNDYTGAGAHDVTWDRTAEDGRRVPPGVYFVKLGQLGKSSVQKLMVVK